MTGAGRLETSLNSTLAELRVELPSARSAQCTVCAGEASILGLNCFFSSAFTSPRNRSFSSLPFLLPCELFLPARGESFDYSGRIMLSELLSRAVNGLKQSNKARRNVLQLKASFSPTVAGRYARRHSEQKKERWAEPHGTWKKENG